MMRWGEKESYKRIAATCPDVEAIGEELKAAVGEAVAELKRQVTVPFREALAGAEEELDDLRDQVKTLAEERDEARADLVVAEQRIADLEAALSERAAV